MSLTQAEFNLALKRYPKPALAAMIKDAGLRKRHERCLYLQYIDEYSLTEIGGALSLTTESAGNLACKARKELKRVLDAKRSVFF